MAATGNGSKIVLNVGGGSRAIPLPAYYGGWEQRLLDLNPYAAPDIVCDARELTTLAAESYDAVYCSHNLEHYYWHDLPRVLGGFLHVLKPDGFAEIRVPDIGGLMRRVAEHNLDLEDVVYESPAGPVAVLDMIYGMRSKVEGGGELHGHLFAHKTGFSASSLPRLLHACGFPRVWCGSVGFELVAYAFKTAPGDYHRGLFGITIE